MAPHRVNSTLEAGRFVGIVVAILSVHSLADTIIPGGLIDVDTVWTAADSPYIVTGNVLLAPDTTLEIEPDVEVRFEPDTGLVSDGLFLAVGSDAQPIVFTSNAASPNPNDWDGLLFTEVATGAVYDRSGEYRTGSILDHCVVEYAGPGVRGYSAGCPYMRNSTIRLCAHEAVRFAGVHSDPTGTIRLDGNTFEGTGIGNTGQVELRDLAHAIVADNRFTHGREIVIENCARTTFERNLVGEGVSFTVNGSTDYPTEGLVGTNIFSLFDSNETYIRMTQANLSFTKNRVTALTCFTLIRVNDDFTGAITDNDIRVPSNGQCSLGIDLGSREGFELSNNNIYFATTPPDGTLLVQATTEQGDPQGQIVDAEMNWWGTVDASEIEDWILHFVDDTARPFVDFVPFRDEPILLAGDWNDDNDSDFADFQQFQLCFTGPDGDASFSFPCMYAFDFDLDGDIDLDDFAALQDAMTDPEQ